jgi:hypothetical protein
MIEDRSIVQKYMPVPVGTLGSTTDHGEKHNLACKFETVS